MFDVLGGEVARNLSQPPGSLDHKRIDSDQIARK